MMTDVRKVQWRKALTLVCFVVLIALALFGWYRAFESEAQTARVCRTVAQDLAMGLYVLADALESNNSRIYRNSAGFLLGEIGALDRCPQTPLDDHLYGTLYEVIAYGMSLDTGLWDNATARQVFADGSLETRDLLLVDSKQAALDRLQLLEGDLCQMGFCIP